MKKRAFSLLVVFVLTLTAFAAFAPTHVHADDFRCPECDAFLGDGRDFCAECWFCEDCETICDECGYCHTCAVYNLGIHCPECGDSCISEEYGDVPHCEGCHKCEECVELYETSAGLMCADCIEERGATYEMCPQCGLNAVSTDLEGELDESDLEAIFEALHPGECGVHCETCFEEFCCPECGECTLCKGVELCGTCGICEECAVSAGYHCPECGECYADKGQCPDGGEHCSECCEYVCESCGKCADGAGLEYCESCHMCEECWPHCEVCGECFEDNGECEFGGDHCAECCIREGWLCGECGRCVEALGLEVCEFCGLCKDCCGAAAKYYGLKNGCVLDKSVDAGKIDASKHDENHHILRYTSSSDECHDVWCAFPGCDYYLSDCTPHDFKWKTVKNATESEEGLRKGICVYCGHEKEETVPKLELPTYYFIKQPGDAASMKEKSSVSIDVEIGVVGEYGAGAKYARLAAIPYNEGDVLPERWDELKKNVYSFACGSGPAVIYRESNYAMNYGGKYLGMTAAGTKMTWVLAIYDLRGDCAVTYSDPFVIDWNAPHNEHNMVYKCIKYDPKSATHYILDIGGEDPHFRDGTYHLAVCSDCGHTYGILSNHRYKLKTTEATCKKTVKRYVCVDCGHKLEINGAGDSSKHVWQDSYGVEGTRHYRVCSVCGAKGDWGKHDYEKYVSSTCEKVITVTVCKVCGDKHIERESGSHKYGNDGPNKGWFADNTHHWKVCSKCGQIKKEAHNYKDGHCTVCGVSSHQMTIVGSLCAHGVLHIERSDDIGDLQKTEFDAGRYGVTWIDDETGETLGLGKTYELGPEDEGRRFRAEVSFMNTDGWEWWEKDWNAYMEELAVTTKYKTVKGYAATCAAEGLKEHKVCLGCGDKFINGKKVTDVVIPKTDVHTFTNACDRVCNVCGFEREITHKWEYTFDKTGHYSKCSVCGAKSEFQSHVIEATLVKAPSCGVEGLFHKTCVCGYETDEVIPAYPHKFVRVDAVAATCVSQGVAEHYVCEGCKAKSKDAAGKEPVGINKLLLPVDPENHVGGEMGYNSKEHYTVCACGARLEAAAHTFGEDGRCSVCHYKKGSDVKTGAAGLTRHDMVAPTCIDTGMKEHYTDSDGHIYLSKAGMAAVKAEDLVLAKSTVKHVGGEYGHSASEHWIDCACGEKLLITKHDFDEHGHCAVCGYSQASGWWIWLVVGVAAVAVCGVTVFLVVFFNKKKKKDEAAKV